MKAWIKTKARKDGKHAVTYGFSNGRRIKKIRTVDQLSSEFIFPFETLKHMNPGELSRTPVIFIET